MSPQQSLIRNYLNLLESFVDEPDAYAKVFHPEFRQTELPNLLNRNGQESDLTSLFARMKAGKGLLSKQTYEVLGMVEEKDRLVTEALWTGTVAADLGPFKKGQELKAHFCMVFEFRDGLLYRQRNYDCFEPF